MITTVQKWGNSLGLRIPRSFAIEADLASGSQVNLTIRNGRLVVVPLASAKYDLGQLLAKVGAKNKHGSAWPDDVAGREQSL